MARRRRATALGLFVVALATATFAGCGAGGRQPAPQAPPERFDRRPALPPGWTRVVNERVGYSFGLPPGWRASGVRITLVRSRDGAVSVAVSGDRSTDGEALTGLDDYARRTVRELRGYRALRTGQPVRLARARYPTVTVRATGAFRATGVRQDILVAAIRRPGRVTFSMLFFRNRRTQAAAYAPAIRRMIRSFRGQAPQF